MGTKTKMKTVKLSIICKKHIKGITSIMLIICNAPVIPWNICVAVNQAVK